MSGTYKDLEVWQAAMKMVFDVHRDTAIFPRQKMFGLTSQLGRAAVSVASNIAEGKGRFLIENSANSFPWLAARSSKSRLRKRSLSN
jgi:four helix bundle protein